MRQLLLSATLLLSSCLGLLRAEAQEYRYEFGASLASNYYIGDLGRQGIIAPQSLGIALELRRALSLRWTLSSELALRGLRGSGTFASNTYPSDGRTLSFSRTLTDIALGGEFHFFPYSDRERYLGTRSWTPFIGAGLGLAGGESDSKLQLIPGVCSSGDEVQAKPPLGSIGELDTTPYLHRSSRGIGARLLDGQPLRTGSAREHQAPRQLWLLVHRTPL